MSNMRIQLCILLFTDKVFWIIISLHYFLGDSRNPEEKPDKQGLIVTILLSLMLVLSSLLQLAAVSYEVFNLTTTTWSTFYGEMLSTGEVQFAD